MRGKVAAAPKIQRAWKFVAITLLAAAGLLIIATAANAAFLAGGPGKPGYVLKSTPQGGWSPQGGISPTEHFTSLTWDATGNQWVASLKSGTSGTGNACWTTATSSTGSSWNVNQPCLPGQGHLNDISTNGNTWAMVGIPRNNGGNPPCDGQIAYSTNAGATWNAVTPNPPGNLEAVANNGAQWVAVGYSCSQTGGMIATSSNGIIWTPQIFRGTWYQFMDVATDGNNWVAVGEVGGQSDSVIMVSSDLINWQAVPHPYSNNAGRLLSVAYGDGLWVAVGDSGLPNGGWPYENSLGGKHSKILTSTGPPNWTWTERDSTTRAYLNSVAHDPCGWAAATSVDTSGVGYNGVLTSIDGIEWTPTVMGDAPMMMKMASNSHPCAPKCTITPNPAMAGQPIIVAASLGAPPFQWSTASTGPWSATPPASFSNAGRQAAWVGAANTPYTDYCTVDVIDVLTCTSNSPVYVGDTAIVTAHGGQPTQHQWSAPTATTTTGTGGQFSTSFTQAGNHLVTVENASPAQSKTCTIQVNNPPPLACSGPMIIGRGIPELFVGTGGRGAYTWTAPTATTQTVTPSGFEATYSNLGTHVIKLHDQDAQEAECRFDVIDPPVTCKPHFVQTNPQLAITLEATGGTGTYSWVAPSAIPASGTEPDFKTSFPVPGTYIVQVTSDAQTSECKVKVEHPPKPPPAGLPYPHAPPVFHPPGSEPPIAVIQASHSMECGQRSFMIDGLASHDRDGLVVQWIWMLGDGGIASGATITHEYAEPGIYPLRLTVSDDTGLATSIGMDVLVAACGKLRAPDVTVSATPGKQTTACIQPTGGKGTYTFTASLPTDATLSNGCITLTPIQPGRTCIPVTVVASHEQASAKICIEAVQPAQRDSPTEFTPRPSEPLGQNERVRQMEPAPEATAIPSTPPSAESSYARGTIMAVSIMAALAFVTGLATKRRRYR